MRVLGGILATAMVCGVYVIGGAAHAAGPGQPKVEYSATMTAGGAEGSMTMKVYHAAGVERREMTMGGERSIQIIRFDRKVLWVLMPAQRMYMEAPADGDEFLTDMSGHDRAKMTKVGEEKVNGVKAAKYQVSETEEDGSHYEGFVWLTDDNIPVKFEMTGAEGRSTMELSDLKIGKQDPKLFEIPAGYTKFDMGAMMQGMQGMQNR